ncbi:TPA: hypothetical protein ACPVXD_003285 [Vibrio parahaemolyticus]
MDTFMTFIEITEQTANKINSIANWITIIGAALVLIGTIAVVWSSGVKEQFSNEKILNNKTIAEVAGAEAAKANAEAEKAREHAAYLSKEAEQAKLEQQRLKAQLAWRRLSRQQYQLLYDKLNGNISSKVWVTFVGTDPESTLYREDINSALLASDIKTSYFSGYEMAVGLKIVGPPSKEKDILINAFKDAGLIFEVLEESGFADKHLQVLVGSKPPTF